MINDIQRFMRAYSPGDVIAFGGRCFTSRGIEFFTTSQVSHVGVIYDRAFGTNAPNIIESTSLGKGKAGVIIRPLEEAIANYKGRIWWLPLSQIASMTLNRRMFWDFCWKHRNKQYDFLQVAGVALNRIPWLGKRLTREDDYRKMFCSELVAGAFKVGGILSERIDASHVTPEEICEFGLYTEAIQLLGPHKELTCVNRQLELG